MKHRLSLVILVLLTFFCCKVKSQDIIAQVTAFTPYSGYSCMNIQEDEFFSMYASIGQTFKSLISTQLSTVQFDINNLNSAGTISLEIYSCTDPTTWENLLGTKSGIAINSAGPVIVDVSGLNITVSADSYYGFKILPDLGFDASLEQADNDVYPDGCVWGSGFEFSNIHNDLTFTVKDDGGLPVSLVSFTAQKQKNQVLLKWGTAGEQNTKNFIVRRSNDGSHWNDIGTVPAHGNSITFLQYSFEDVAPVTGMNYYRLQQTDVDEKYSYSAIRAVQFSNDSEEFVVLENPISNKQLELKVFKQTLIRLFDGTGKLLWSKQMASGIHRVDFSAYRGGIYFLKGDKTSEEIVVQ